MKLWRVIVLFSAYSLIFICSYFFKIIFIEHNFPHVPAQIKNLFERRTSSTCTSSFWLLFPLANFFFSPKFDSKKYSWIIEWNHRTKNDELKYIRYKRVNLYWLQTVIKYCFWIWVCTFISFAYAWAWQLKCIERPSWTDNTLINQWWWLA